MAYTPFTPGSVERPTTSVGRFCESNWINCQFPITSSCQGGISAAGAIAPATMAAAFDGSMDGFPGAAGVAKVVDEMDEVTGLLVPEIGGAWADWTIDGGTIDVTDCCGVLNGTGTTAVGTVAAMVVGGMGMGVVGVGVVEFASKYSLLVHFFVTIVITRSTSTSPRSTTGLENRAAIYIGFGDKFSSLDKSSVCESLDASSCRRMSSSPINTSNSSFSHVSTGASRRWHLAALASV